MCSWWLTRIVFSLLLLCGVASSAHAWGDLGHTIICDIAFQELSSPAQAKVKRLLRQDEKPEFREFAAACTWPDHPRRRGGEHFLNLPRAASEVREDRCPMASTCLFTGIKKDTQVLAGSRATETQRRASLKFLGHWVGDIHQPLHVSYADDRGGNSVGESGSCSGGNLHSVWDTCLIQRGLGQDAKAIARQLRGEITAEERAQWSASSSVEWAKESYAITTTPSVEYCVRTQEACQYSATKGEFHTGDAQRKVNVDTAYVATHLPTVKGQLKKAGVRLGHLLNSLLDPQP